MIDVEAEIQKLSRIRQLKSEPRELYLCRAARALSTKLAEAAEKLSPRAYSWLKHGLARIESGGWPLEFDDPAVEVSVADQLFDLLEVEDEVFREKTTVRNKKLRKTTKETRKADSLRVAQYLLMYPGASDDAAATSLSSTGWMVSENKVASVRAEIKRTFLALKESGFTVHRPDGTRILSI